jgi:hypothetical protein
MTAISKAERWHQNMHTCSPGFGSKRAICKHIGEWESRFFHSPAFIPGYSGI